MKRILIPILLGTFLFSVFVLETKLNKMVDREGNRYKERQVKKGQTYKPPVNGRFQSDETTQKENLEAPWLAYDEFGKLK